MSLAMYARHHAFARLHRRALCLVLAAHGFVLAAALTLKTPLPGGADTEIQFVEIRTLSGSGGASSSRTQPVLPAPVAKPRPRIRPSVPQERALPVTMSEQPGTMAASVLHEPEQGGGPGSQEGEGEEGDEEARFDAAYLQNPVPSYPLQSRRLGEEGRLILRVLVSEEGFARQVELNTSSGSRRLDEAALKTVRQWRFIPARRGGKAVESWAFVPVLFKLEKLEK